MSASLDDHPAMVTGAGRGIGRAIAVQIGGAGASVGLVARSSDELEETGRQVKAVGGQGLPIPAGLGQLSEVHGVAERAHDGLGQVDVLVNNAAVVWPLHADPPERERHLLRQQSFPGWPGPRVNIESATEEENRGRFAGDSKEPSPDALGVFREWSPRPTTNHKEKVMRIITRLPGRRLMGPLVLALAAIGAFALPGSAFAASRSSAGVGHVYLDGNTTAANTIAAYNRAPDGSLTPTPGSPFAAGGAGLGTGLGSQGAIQLADHGRYLLAVDAGSNQISVLQTNRDGSLTQVPSSPVSSGGVEPVSIAVHDHLVYVANDGNATTSANYTGFILTKLGKLVPLPNSTVDAPRAANDLGDVLFNSTGTKLVGTEVASSLIDSFRVDRLGYLETAPGSPYAGQGLGAFGSAFRPTNPDQLFVSNPHNLGNNVGTVSAFDVANSGKLLSIGSSPFADLQNAPCWVAITPDGRYLFAVNTGSGTVSRFSIDRGGNLTLLGSTPVNDNGGVGGTDPTITPHGRNLYINETAAHGIAEMSIKGGTLTELPGSPIALPASITAAAGAASN